VDTETAAVNPGTTLPSESGAFSLLRSVSWVESLWYLAVLLLIAGAGVLNLYRPLHGDTALFLLGAEAMDRGDLLYVDFWDNKPPGVYVFYYVAGRLFGFTSFGVHLFELCWMLAFAVVMFAVLRSCLHGRWLSAVPPLVFLTTYWFRSDSQTLMQVEALVGFPTFVSAWLLTREWSSSGGKFVSCALAGVAAAVAVAFKLVFAPLFVVFVLVATVEQVRRCRPTARIAFVAGMWAAYTAGVAAVLGAIVLIFASRGTLDALLWTTFIYPELVMPEIAEGLVTAAPFTRLFNSLGWWLGVFAPWLPFAGVGVACCLRHRGSALLRMMLVWLAGGLGVILLQRFSWWAYHMTLLFVPMSVLAARGLDALLTILASLGLSARRAVAATVMFLIFPAAAASAATAADQFPKVKRVFDGADPKPLRIARYQQNADEMYLRLAPVAEAIGAPDALAGDIYVFGNPLIYLFTGRRQALPVHGWSWEMFVEPLWERLPDDLRDREPVYIFVDPELRRMIARRSPQVLDFIEARYTAIWSSREGVWYRLQRPT